MNRLVLYAPGVHCGGGLVLLRALLEQCGDNCVAILDQRAAAYLPAHLSVPVRWIAPDLLARLHAEWRLRAEMDEDSVLLCFHGLPPLLRQRVRTLLFVQNRLLLQGGGGARAAVKRLLLKLGRNNVDRVVVQTATMAQAAAGLFASGAVTVLPFADAAVLALNRRRQRDFDRDFIYVADGMAHKNHRLLLEAWRLLKQRGLTPSLLLTLGERDAALRAELLADAAAAGLNVANCGDISRAELLELLRRSRALIYPSLLESFGLPLLEARQLGVPIVAAELDYVRDVCEPQQTFDCHSPLSIARAVERFLARAEQPCAVMSAADFVAALLQTT